MQRKGMAPFAALLLLFLSVLIISNQAEAPTIARASVSPRDFQENSNAGIIVEKIKAFPVSIFTKPSVFQECNEHPEKYDLYDGELFADNRPCANCYFENLHLEGTSMLPTIQNGANINIKRGGNYSSLPAGTIINFDSFGQNAGVNPASVVHRIVGVDDVIQLEKTATGYRALTNDYSVTWDSSSSTTQFEKPFYVVKGDNNQGCELVPANMVRGVYTQ